jgi:predicted acylesterase/phospholipase RssA
VPERPTIGLAISGGGHRATIWGLGVLLYLVDSGKVRDLVAISSVSGGSIANGFVAHEIPDLQDVVRDEFRQRIKPLLGHVAHEGLFFFGPATNPYVRGVMALLAAFGVLSLLVVGIGGAAALGVAWEAARPKGLGLREAGLTVALVCVPLAAKLARVGTRDRVAPDRLLVGGLWALASLGAATWVLGWLGINPTASIPIAVGWLVGAWVVTAISALFTLEVRSRVADRALAKVHFGEKAPTELQAVGGRVAHIFCATELQAAVHAYFSPRFVYSHRHGWAKTPPGLPLSTAVQASACLPGAFVPRRLDVSGYGWERSHLQGRDLVPAEAPSTMLLSDGGVYDNMADQWFQGHADRVRRIPALKALSHPPVDTLVVANASGGWVWREARAPRLRSLRELQGISRAKSVMYDATTAHRRQGLIARFQAAETRGFGMLGTLVHIPQSPFRVARGFEKSRDQQRRARAAEVIAHLGEDTEDEWEQVARANTGVETVLRALGTATTARLLRHAYVLAMCNSHVLFGWGLRPIPAVEEIEALVGSSAPRSQNSRETPAHRESV